MSVPETPSKEGVFSRLKRFDAYPKTSDDFRVRTFSGATVSVVAGIIMLGLFASELSYFLSTEVQPELFVDTSRNEKMRINIDVFFPHLPCAYMSIDVMDVSGETQLDVEHNLFKRRHDKSGLPIREGVEKHEELGSGNKTVGNSTAPPLDPARCESCYGAENSNMRCCNNCDDVREAYRVKGWSFNNPKGIAQCEREGFTDKMTEQAEEGCSVYGFLLVNKVAGNFHFAPGKSFQQHNMHIHDMQAFQNRGFNMSHTVNKLSFGLDYPGVVNPLDGYSELSNEKMEMFSYYIKVVPTRYIKLNGAAINTNQFSVTTHRKTLYQGDAGLPGAFFMFEPSPILVQLTEQKRSFTHFLTAVCAIIGGVFTVAGMIDAFIYHTIRRMQKQQQGKLG